MPIIIREATSADALGVATVHVLSWRAAYRGIIPDDYLDNLNIAQRAERFVKDFVEYKGITHYYVAENDGAIIGNLAIGICRDEDKPQTGEVIGIYFLQEYWGFGYGKNLMDFAIEKLSELGYRNICLWVLEENVRAKRFYEKYGFTPDGAKKEIFKEKPLVVVRYALSTRK